MIGIVDVEVQAANPQMPLCPFVAFVGSPSSVRVRNVPGNVGSWNITKVYVSANYPDNSIQSRECTRVGEIYVGTLPACDTVGKGANGFVVSADGVDESGNAVTGYVLGKGDLEILDADGAITPGVTTHYVHGLDEQPSDPHEYDIYKDGDTWKIYFNGAWEPFAAPVTLDNTVTKDSANGVKSSGIWAAIWGALAALPTGFSSLYDWCASQLAGKVPTSRTINSKSLSSDVTLTGADIAVSDTDATKIDAALAGKASKADATLTEKYGDEWRISANKGPNGGALEVVYGVYISPTTWTLVEDGSSSKWHATGNPPADATSLSFNMDGTPVAATRFIGYQLGSQTDKPLASEAEAVALRMGKMSASATGADILVGGSEGTASSSIASAINDLFRVKADLDSPTFTGTPVAPTPQDGDNSALIATTAFVQGAVPYALVTKTISNGAVSLDDRASNAVTVSATLSPNTLTINFPTAPTGKLRDFAMRLNIAAGVTAPELAWPQGVTLENNGGEVPEIADGGTGGSSTILYFSESENNGTTAKFTVKGETLTAIAQA